MTIDDEERFRATVLELIEDGDVDNQPWAFYEHDHGGLKGYKWTAEQAMNERYNFAYRLAERLKINS